MDFATLSFGTTLIKSKRCSCGIKLASQMWQEKNGINVAVKVQRPNLHHVVVRDVYILRLGLGLLQKIAKRKSDPRLYADELGKGFVGELDYTLEAANASKFLEFAERKDNGKMTEGSKGEEKAGN
ncbi:hypothetical protein HN51_004046 [Arachis hypogaea]